jgi:hypothetical protein
VDALILASVPMNSEAGSYLTFGGPVGLFVVVAAILYVLFSRPHRRVPPRRALAPGKAGISGTGNVSGTTAGSEAPADETPRPDKNTEASE